MLLLLLLPSPNQPRLLLELHRPVYVSSAPAPLPHTMTAITDIIPSTQPVRQGPEVEPSLCMCPSAPVAGYFLLISATLSSAAPSVQTHALVHTIQEGA